MNIKHIAMNYDKVLFLACNDISKDLKELNAFDIEEAIKIIAGSARSMGIQVKE